MSNLAEPTTTTESVAVPGPSAYAFGIALLLLAVLQGILSWVIGDLFVVQCVMTGLAALFFITGAIAIALVRQYNRNK